MEKDFGDRSLRFLVFLTCVGTALAVGLASGWTAPAGALERVSPRRTGAATEAIKAMELFAQASASGTPEIVLDQHKISATSGGFAGDLDLDDRFGSALASLGDLDGNRAIDLAVGATFDDDGGTDRGAVWNLFRRPSASETPLVVLGHQKISSIEGSFPGPLSDGDRLGTSVASLGDLDGDGVVDLAVGTPTDDTAGSSAGAVWILFPTPQGTIRTGHKITTGLSGFTGLLEASDTFGVSVAAVGDLDGDGVVDLAVGADLDDDGGSGKGAVWILFLRADGTVKSHRKISEGQGGFSAQLPIFGRFGRALGALGDLDGDGAPDLAVGAELADDGGADRGEVWLLFLQPDGSVKSHRRLSADLAEALPAGGLFGSALARLGLDAGGNTVLAVGSRGHDEPASNTGAVWLVSLGSQGQVQGHRRIAATEEGFEGAIETGDFFGSALAAPGDLDGDGAVDLWVGASGNDDGLTQAGAVWTLFLNPSATSTATFAYDFDASPLSGEAPLTVQFQTLQLGTTPATSFRWDFDGDGLVDDTGANPTHTYTEAGIFSVTLIASDVSLTDLMHKPALIVVEAEPTPPPSTLPPFTRVTTGALARDTGPARGVGFGDLDGDGDPDLLLAHHGISNTLFFNDGDGTFTADGFSIVSRGGGNSNGVSLADFDDDGDLDLFVANNAFFHSNFLYENLGGGAFALVRTGPLVADQSSSMSAAWADVEGDGDLDLFVANASFQRNRFYRNEGGGVFTEIFAGPVVSGASDSFGAVWADLNDDLLPDLFVANRSGDNFLFQGLGGGAFSRITVGDAVDDGGRSHSASWGDLDNDGDFDLSVANGLAVNGSGDNFLYRADGTTLSRILDGPPVGDGANSEGSAWGDADNDGDLDLFVANSLGQTNLLYENLSDSLGDGTFREVLEGPLVSDAGSSRSAVWVDVDGDGDLDLFVTQDTGDPNLLYLNAGNGNHWLQVRLVGTASNRFGIGATVRVRATIAGAVVEQTRRIESQSGLMAHGPFLAHFGLGDATVLEEVRIEWPSGAVQVLTNVAADRVLTVVE